MRKGIALAIITAALLMTACGKGGEKAPDSQQAPESTAAAQEKKERTEIADIADLAHDVKGEGVLTYDEYKAAELGSEVTIEAYLQAKHKLIDGKASLCTQDADGAYFLYKVPLTQEEYDALELGQKLRVTGKKSEYSLEVEILDAKIEKLEGGRYFASPADVTELLGRNSLIDYQNLFVSFTDMTVEPAKEGSKDAILYKWDGSGKQGDDLYFHVSAGGRTYEFVVETDLCDSSSEVYKAAEQLKVGDKVYLEGFLYWYLGPSPQITAIEVQ